MKYRITFLNNIKVSGFSIGTVILYLLVTYSLQLKSHGVVYGLLVYFIFYLPALYVHILYYMENKNQEIEVNSHEVILNYLGKEICRYKKEELQKIIIYKPATLDKDSFGFQVTPFESYNYARIIPIKGEEIVFTCLLLPDVEKAFKILSGVSRERKKGLFFNIERPNGGSLR